MEPYLSPAMADTVASALLFTTIVFLALLLITALHWAFTHPSFRASRQAVRNLVMSLEDLALPMGSFPSEQLHPWTPRELIHESNHTILPPSMTLAPESGRSELDSQSPTSKPTRDDGRAKPLVVPSPTRAILLNNESNATTMPPSAFPTPSVDNPEPNAGLLTPAQAAINRVSSPEANFALMLSTPDDGGLALSTLSRWTRRQTGNIELNATNVQPFTSPTTGGDQLPVSDNRADQAFPVYPSIQQSPEESSLPLPEQTEAEIDALGKRSDIMSEEMQKDQKNKEDDGTAAAEEVLTEGKAPEQQIEVSTTAVEEVPTKSQAFEVAIRALVDPDESSGSTSLEHLVALVADVLKGRAEADEKLKSEVIRFSRQEEDLRHGWIDQREYIERVINGQNDFVYDKEMESNRLFRENSRLVHENSELKEKLEERKEQHKRDVKTLGAEKKFAEDAESTALAQVEDRINQLKQRHETERMGAASSHMQEINTQICLRRMVQDELDMTRHHLTAAENAHKDTVKDKNRAIRGLRAEVSQMEPAVAAAVERETSTKDRLEKDLKDQRKDKDDEISNLQKQLREAKNEVRSLTRSKITLDTAAEIRQLEIQRLSTTCDEEKASLREGRDHVVGGLKLDKAGLERTIRDCEAEITSLKLKITELESGHEVRSLQSQLRDQKKKLRKAAKEMEVLHKKGEAQESRRSEEGKRASQEKEGLEKQLTDLKDRLAEVLRSKECQDRAVEVFKEQKQKLSHEIQVAQGAEQKMRTDMQHVQNEQARISTQHQDLIREKDEKILHLQQAVQVEDGSRQKATFYETVLNEKGGEIMRLQQTVQQQDQWRLDATRHHENTVKETDEEIRRLQEAVRLAKDGEVAKDRRLEGEQKKAADEKRAKDAANAARTTLQHQLDDERQASRDARAKAVETETEMRKEIMALKSEASKVEERQAHNLVSNQASKEAQEKAVPLVQANDGIPRERVIRKPRALKRPDKPSSGMLAQPISTSGQAGNDLGQSQQTHGPSAPQPMPQRDQRRPFLDLLASVTPTSAIEVEAAPRQEPATGSQPLVPSALGDGQRAVNPERPIRIVRGRGRGLLVSASANKPSTENKKPIGQMQAGWMKDVVGS